ncbi:unnamed protein product [Protopolystoma xenopodis]|uniref:Uncharacterized protein n=1 Tax=Protopolystoma xenopodis TaxID=117903 RepID=A0A448XH87_9PLAT|nr:unnamed protein product [Protopolystoma xenopodis]
MRIPRYSHSDSPDSNSTADLCTGLPEAERDPELGDGIFSDNGRVGMRSTSTYLKPDFLDSSPKSLQVSQHIAPSIFSPQPKHNKYL